MHMTMHAHSRRTITRLRQARGQSRSCNGCSTNPRHAHREHSLSDRNKSRMPGKERSIAEQYSPWPERGETLRHDARSCCSSASSWGRWPKGAHSGVSPCTERSSCARCEDPAILPRRPAVAATAAGSDGSPTLLLERRQQASPPRSGAPVAAAGPAHASRSPPEARRTCRARSDAGAASAPVRRAPP